MEMINDGIQKKVNITYDSMEELLQREPHITKTLESYLLRDNSEQYIKDTSISMSGDKYLLTFTLDKTK